MGAQSPLLIAEYRHRHEQDAVLLVGVGRPHRPAHLQGVGHLSLLGPAGRWWVSGGFWHCRGHERMCERSGWLHRQQYDLAVLGIEAGQFGKSFGHFCNDPLVSAHPTQLMQGVLGVPHSPETDVAVLRCSTGSSD